MKLTFQLRFRTRFGQSLFITGTHPLLGGGDFNRAVPLQYLNEELWAVTIEWPADQRPDPPAVYNYVLRDPDGSLTYDWGSDKAVQPGWFTSAEVLVIDAWNDAGSYENAFYTEPFKQVLLRANHASQPDFAPDSTSTVVTPHPSSGHPLPIGWGEGRGEGHSHSASLAAPADAMLGSAAKQTRPPPQATHTFRAKAPLLQPGQTLCVLGGGHVLGAWNTGTPVLLQRATDEDFLSVPLDLSGETFPLVYKYGVYDVASRKFVRFEDGPNRVLHDHNAPGKHTIVNDGFAVLPSDTWKGAGVAIPVFSLRSVNSFGIGEFTDLKLLADWCVTAGLKLIQILPVNDTTASFTQSDSYPYAAISAFGLNPVYLNLGRMAGAENKPLMQAQEDERKRLNALPAVDYEAVARLKFDLLKKIYPSQKAATLRSGAYQQFLKENEHWLLPYAVFCHLRDEYGTSDFNHWPAHRTCLPADTAALAAPGSAAAGAVGFYCFLQYHLHLQLREATDYAHKLGVILKGDIAIGVSRCGADTWQQPELYHLEMQAGAPPDDFAVKGQNWGFPTYNWPRMMEDGFLWWKHRFGQMSRYFDAFRVDHILGFFRIWSVPQRAVEGILGYFVPAIPVRREEFHARGIWFDRDRYVRPYITEALVREVFGDDAPRVMREFLDAGASGHFALKPEFDTQRKVERRFAALKPGARNQKIRAGLFDLIANVILLEAEEPPGNQFHFRFAMENTASFKSLPADVQEPLKALYLDYFFRRQDDFWRQEAMQKLPALKRATNMLVCGEDLGLVPACVPGVMRQLGLLTLEVQRMPKEPDKEFSRPKDAPYLSVVTPATHDMSTIRGWWREDPARTQKFFATELGQTGDAPADCAAWINRAIVAQHLDSPAMWSIFQLQDLLGLDEKLRRENPDDERINVPADPAHYWRYRMHLNLETLKQAKAFNAELKALVERSGR